MTFVINLCPKGPLLQIRLRSNTAITRSLVQGKKKLKFTEHQTTMDEDFLWEKGEHDTKSRFKS
jgi:hypothetical protein